MKLRKSTVALGVLLAISVLGNIGQGLRLAGSGIMPFYENMYRQHEIAALRSFGEKVAAGGAPRAVLVDAGAVPDKDGWLANSTLRAKFEGEQLVKLCGSMSLEPDTCAEEAK